MAERTTLYSPDGRPYSTTSPTEITRLKAGYGYTDTPPEQLLAEHPELADAIVAAERKGKNRSSIVAG